jgi:hypothetical protein
MNQFATSKHATFIKHNGLDALRKAFLYAEIHLVSPVHCTVLYGTQLSAPTPLCNRHMSLLNYSEESDDELVDYLAGGDDAVDANNEFDY